MAFAGINELLPQEGAAQKGGEKKKSCGNKYDNEEVHLSVCAAAADP